MLVKLASMHWHWCAWQVAGQAVQLPWLTHRFQFCCTASCHTWWSCEGRFSLVFEIRCFAVLQSKPSVPTTHVNFTTVPPAPAGAQHQRKHQQERVRRVPAGQGQGATLFLSCASSALPTFPPLALPHSWCCGSGMPAKVAAASTFCLLSWSSVPALTWCAAPSMEPPCA